MTEEALKAEFRIGKTQWALWGNPARRAFNRSMRLGFTFETAMAEAHAVQAKQESIHGEVQVPEEAAEAPVEAGQGEEAPSAESAAPAAQDAEPSPRPVKKTRKPRAKKEA